MLNALGLVNRTPPAFSAAVEDGTDVSVGTLAQTLGLFKKHDVDALVYNEQTSGQLTDQVRKAADAAGIAQVPVTETPPPREHLHQLDGLQHHRDHRRRAVIPDLRSRNGVRWPEPGSMRSRTPMGAARPSRPSRCGRVSRRGGPNSVPMSRWSCELNARSFAGNDRLRVVE